MRLCILFLGIISMIPTSTIQADEITFFGGIFHADSVVFCVDMSAAAIFGQGELVVKTQAIDAINQLNSATFSVVAYGGDTPREFSGSLLAPTAANKAAAVSWINALAPMGSHCLVSGLDRSLEIIGSNVNSPMVLASLVGTTYYPVACGTDVVNPNCVPINVYPWITGGKGMQIASYITARSWQCATEFRRGDCNGDGVVNLPDALDLAAYLFDSNNIANACPAARDINRDLVLNLADIVYLLEYLFVGGTPPSQPGPIDCGDGGSPNNLNCHQYTACP